MRDGKKRDKIRRMKFGLLYAALGIEARDFTRADIVALYTRGLSLFMNFRKIFLSFFFDFFNIKRYENYSWLEILTIEDYYHVKNFRVSAKTAKTMFCVGVYRSGIMKNPTFSD